MQETLFTIFVLLLTGGLLFIFLKWFNFEDK